MGFYIWQETQWVWMFVGTLVFGNALPGRIFRPLIVSAVDCIFIVVLLTTELIIDLSEIKIRHKKMVDWISARLRWGVAEYEYENQKFGVAELKYELER